MSQDKEVKSTPLPTLNPNGVGYWYFIKTQFVTEPWLREVLSIGFLQKLFIALRMSVAIWTDQMPTWISHQHFLKKVWGVFPHYVGKIIDIQNLGS